MKTEAHPHMNVFNSNLSQEGQEVRGSTDQHCGHACVCCGCVGWEGGCSETWRQVCEGEGG